MYRICIYAKDIQLITGKSERQARYIIKFIRQTNNKKKHHHITIKELCDYLGIEVESVRHLLR